MTAARIGAGLLLANALDLGSSLCLHGADQQHALAPRPAWVWVLQLLLLLPLAYLALRAAPAISRRLRELPVPPALQALIALTLVVQLGHVLLRSEHYPFSAVTMFSDYVPDQQEPAPRRLALYLTEDGQPVSFLREGSPWFARYLHVDYKTGWLLGTHAQHSRAASVRVAALLSRAGGRNPRLSRVEVDPHDGSLHALRSAQAGR